MLTSDLTDSLVELLRGPETKRAAESLGWDSSQVSRFLSGELGIKKPQLNIAVSLCKKSVIDFDEHLHLLRCAQENASYKYAQLSGR